MGSIKSIVDVQITRDTTVPSRAGFGTGAFVSSTASFSTATKSYASVTEVEEDATAGADTLVFAGFYFGQSLAPTKLTVIKEGTGSAQISTLVFDAALITDNVINVYLDGAALADVTETYAVSNADTLTAIAAALQLLPAITTAVSDGTDTLTIIWADNFGHRANVFVTDGVSQAEAVHAVTTAHVTDIVAGLSAAEAYDNDWYGVAQYSRLDADILATAAWVQGRTNTNPKLFFAQSDDANILDVGETSDVASLMKALAYFRTSVWYHAIDAEFLEGALMGGQLPQDPGSITWAYKTLSGVTPDTAMTSGQKSAAHGKNCNTYDTVASVSITEEGKVSDTGSGEWIDVMRGVDWITANMTADLYSMLVNTKKVPFTSNGLATVRSNMSLSLLKAQAMGILSTDTNFSIVIPALADISAADKGTRTLSGITFTGVLQGAIQKINVRGTVTL